MKWQASWPPVRRVRRCPPPWELTRAVSEGANPGVASHLAACKKCAAELAALSAFSARARAGLPAPGAMSGESIEEIAQALRGSTVPVTQARGARARYLIAAALVLGAGVWGIWRAGAWRFAAPAPQAAPPPPTPSTPTPVQSLATIRAIGPARFTRAQMPPDEVVRLDEGSIELEVTPLHANQHFRVVTDDGEVQVRGTSFKVTAARRQLVAVHVWRGQVSVRSRGGALAMLDPGDDWVRGAVSEEPSSVEGSRRSRPPGESASVPAPTIRTRQTVRAATRPVADASASTLARASFGAAWALLRKGDAATAATRFGELEPLARGSDIEEDVVYWRAVATGRAGDGARARALFGEFLRRFPASPRAGEAAVVLGWLLMDAGDTRAARRAFQRAASDSSAQVQASAQEGLRRTQEVEK